VYRKSAYRPYAALGERRAHIFVTTLGIAAEGPNLAPPNYTVFIGPSGSEHTNQQAFGRADRPGPFRSVHLFLLLDPDKEAEKTTRDREMNRAVVDTQVRGGPEACPSFPP
jgi:hypothetical protein